jgi:hypothetical protein
MVIVLVNFGAGKSPGGKRLGKGIKKLQVSVATPE